MRTAAADAVAAELLLHTQQQQTKAEAKGAKGPKEPKEPKEPKKKKKKTKKKAQEEQASRAKAGDNGDTTATVAGEPAIRVPRGAAKRLTAGGGAVAAGGDSLDVPVFMVSATASDGLQPLRQFLHAVAKPGPWGETTSAFDEGGDEDEDEDKFVEFDEFDDEFDGPFDDDEEGGGFAGRGDRRSGSAHGRLASRGRAPAPVTPAATTGARGVAAVRPAAAAVTTWWRASWTTWSGPRSVREKVFAFVHQEVPYRVRQANRLWETRPLFDRDRDQNRDQDGEVAAAATEKEEEEEEEEEEGEGRAGLG